ncbi:malto-oligosyltrehalose synthase [Rugosimonospora africana]|uniref:Malto-oligosyltrehalose synthase n=1 Tax=Rugosimonospora africana TaxID=556532 RepID=A0A8J3QXE7_9ACTN|nr:malto-oligosyltrehalose synthase [Rugosimonospora africana]GIH17867.1 malto-oligosyltrehalose synthase [Rugosimonospora africana]
MVAPTGLTLPSTTYRVQVRPDFDLAATAEIVDYLAGLGVSHLYSAPLLAAAPGSSHGYDVVDHSRVNPELGGPHALEALVDRLRGAGMGLVVDIVPNHAGVAVPDANPAWWSVLREGRESPYASWFDIDWSRGRLLLPVLGDEPEPLDALKLVDGELRYEGLRYPVAPGTEGANARRVHDAQRYELISGRRGNAEVNYRRFFAVSTLAALRVENPAVFDATHAEVLRWYRRGWVDGIRIDHPDGLTDPAGYLRRLREAAPDAWLVVEKILERGEQLPDWPVAGTTGYEACNDVCGVFVDPAGEAPLTALAPDRGWLQVARQARYEVATTLLAAELSRLARLAPDVPAAAAALAQLASRFPVYRSYLPDTKALDWALRETYQGRPDLGSVLTVLAPRLRDPADPLAVRFQQYTGAVLAKGVEDTAMYRWTRFVARNEVGGTPDRFAVGIEDFHTATVGRHRRWPRAMTTLSTHDTKRSEDVRARLAVLAEMPEEWLLTQARWSTAAPLDDLALVRLLWQTVAGTWPIERDRLQAYLLKAAREASTRTSWEHPDTRFEAGMAAAVDAAYDNRSLRTDIDAFVAGITPYGWSNSLGQKLLQLAMPGVPDTYQGTELWDNSLVDPDNRRPVDFAHRRALLARLDDGWLPPVDETGAAKLLVVSRTLRLRRDQPQRFGGYAPVGARGPAAGHLIGFDRGGAVAVATRLPVRLRRRGGWAETVLPLRPGTWTDALTGAEFTAQAPRVADILARYPVALLVHS